MPVYNLDSIEILTPKVAGIKADDPNAFEQHQIIAESLLGISESSPNSDNAEVVRLAIALQMNYQVEVGLQPFIVASSMRPDKGDSVIYRGGKQMPTVHPTAKHLLNSISQSDLPIVRSIR